MTFLFSLVTRLRQLFVFTVLQQDIRKANQSPTSDRLVKLLGGMQCKYHIPLYRSNHNNELATLPNNEDDDNNDYFRSGTRTTRQAG